MFEKLKKFYKDEHDVKRTYHERPSFFLIGALYIFVVMVSLVLLVQYTTFFRWLFSPLGILSPYVKPYIEPDMTIIGWAFVFLVFFFVIAIIIILILPGFFLIFKYQKLIDIEWPDDPKRTQKWREKKSRQRDDRE